MPESFLNKCKASLSNLIASDRVQSSADIYEAFSEGILNLAWHYCYDDHSSSWCLHNKVNSNHKKITLVNNLENSVPILIE